MTPLAMSFEADPVLTNCEFKDLHHAISCYRAANPQIDNCQMINITYTPVNISGTSTPSMSNIQFTNVGWRAIGLIGGNVCLNGTIQQRNMAGFNNISYILLNDMVINEGSYINIDPGVVIKLAGSDNYYGNFSYGMYGQHIFVKGGLKANGTADNNVIITSVKDDNVGNPLDTNGDGNGSSPQPGNWSYIKFLSEADDAFNMFNYTQLKFGGEEEQGMLHFENSGGKVNNSILINSKSYGVLCNGNANPVINNTDLSSNVYYGIKNEDKSFNVNPTECWWGNNNGPIMTDDEEQNENEQELITSGVNYIPWKNLGAINPAMGDVSLNGLIQAYDASLILKHTVELISLNESQQQVADVSYNGEISALDASLVLQHVVGLENTFPVHKIKRANVETGSQPSIVAESMNIPENENEIEIPVHLYIPAKKLSSDIEIRYNPAHLRLNHIGKQLSNVTIESNFDNLLGKATIGIASATGFEGSLTPVSLHFDIIPETSTVSQVSFSKFKLDEQDYLTMAQSGIITITRINSGTNDVDIQAPGIRSLYPNPVINTSLLIYTTEKESYVELNLYNLMGQKVKSLLSTTLPAGNHNLQIRSDKLENGTYILKMRTDDNSYTHKVQIRK